MGAIQHTSSRFAVLCGLLTLVQSLVPHSAWAPDPTVPSGVVSSARWGAPPAGSGLNFAPPPAFTAFKNMQMSNLFTVCLKAPVAVADLMTSMGEGSMSPPIPGAPVTATQKMDLSCSFLKNIMVNAKCPGNSEPEENTPIECKDIPLSGKSPMLAMREQRLKQKLCTAKCEKSQLDWLKPELQCLLPQVNAFTQQIGALGQEYARIISTMKQQMAQIKMAQADREAQSRYITTKLNGDPDSGNKGLLAVQKALKEAVNQKPAQIQQITERQQASAQEEKILGELTQRFIMSDTMSCFNSTSVDADGAAATTLGGNTCGANLNPKADPTAKFDPTASNSSQLPTMRQLILCRLNTIKMIGPDGRPINNVPGQANANTQTAALDDIFNKMETMAGGSSFQFPTSDEEQQRAFSSPPTLRSMDAVRKYVGSAVSKFGTNGNVAGLVNRILDNCNKMAQYKAQQLDNSTGNQIAAKKYKINQDKQQTTAMVRTIFNQDNQVYSDAIAEMTGQNTPIPLSACQSTKATNVIQLACLRDIQNNQEALLYGNSKYSLNLVIQGTNPQTYIPVTCSGVNDCTNKFQTQSKTVKAAQAQLTTFKTQYAVQGKQYIEAQTQQMAQMLSMQSGQLTQGLNAFNMALSQVGGGTGIRIQGVKPEELKLDEDGLPENPTNVAALIGGRLNPPLPDLSGDGLQGAMQGMGEADTRIRTNLAKIEGQLDRIANLENTCKITRSDKFLDDLNSASAKASQANCHALEMCRGDQMDRTVADMQSALAMLKENAPDFDSFTGLQSGVRTFCAQNRTGIDYWGPDKSKTDAKSVKEREEAEAARRQATLYGTIRASDCQAFQSSLVEVGEKMRRLRGVTDPHLGTSSRTAQ